MNYSLVWLWHCKEIAHEFEHGSQSQIIFDFSSSYLSLNHHRPTLWIFHHLQIMSGLQWQAMIWQEGKYVNSNFSRSGYIYRFFCKLIFVLLIFLPDLQLSFFNNIFFSCNDSNEIIDELLFCHELEKGIIAEYINYCWKYCS